jgi:DNA primase
MRGSSVGDRNPRAAGSDDWVERVRAASDITEVIGESVSLKRVGRNAVGLCPFHKESSPSFSVNAERQFYHCFGCKAGGDVFKFVQEMERVGFLEAVELLSRRAGIPVPDRRGGSEGGLKARLLEALDAASHAYEQWLRDPERGRDVREYLAARGIDDETVRSFRLGLAPAGWENLVQRLGARHAEDVLVTAGLAARREGRGGLYDRFRNRLMVPLVAPGGAVLGFGARALAPEDQPKYLNSPETPAYHKSTFLFALEQARRHVDMDGELIVVEGYFDVIALHQAGLRNAVATSGTALTSEQAKILRRHVARVALTYDGDAAGRDAMMRSLGVLLGEGLDVAVVDLPTGDDPDTLVRRGGTEAWSGVRRAAADPVEFIQRHILRSPGPGDPRERALQAVVRLASEVRDPVRVALLLERAEAVLGLAARTLARAVRLRGTGQRSEAPVAAAVRAQRGREQALERRLLGALLRAPTVLDEATRELSPDDFGEPSCAALAEVLWHADAVPADGPAASLARELEASGDDTWDWDAEARGAIRRMLERRWKASLKERRERLGRAADPEEAVRLMHEIEDIARKLRAVKL